MHSTVADRPRYAPLFWNSLTFLFVCQTTLYTCVITTFPAVIHNSRLLREKTSAHIPAVLRPQITSTCLARMAWPGSANAGGGSATGQLYNLLPLLNVSVSAIWRRSSPTPHQVIQTIKMPDRYGSKQSLFTEKKKPMYQKFLNISNVLLLIVSTILIFSAIILMKFYATQSLGFWSSYFPVVPVFMIILGVYTFVVCMYGFLISGGEHRYEMLFSVHSDIFSIGLSQLLHV